MAALRILITGASSFTGSWFARGLAAAGHDVTATFRQREYDGVRVATSPGISSMREGNDARRCAVSASAWRAAGSRITGA